MAAFTAEQALGRSTWTGQVAERAWDHLTALDPSKQEFILATKEPSVDHPPFWQPSGKSLGTADLQRRFKMKMQRQEIDPPELFKHPSFKRVVTVQGDMKLVFIAGQTPSDENYQCVAPGDYRAQYVHVMTNLDIQLKAAGADWDDVVFRRIFVLDVDAFGKIYFDKTLPKYGDGRPPSTLIGVTRLSNPEYLIEIDLMAVVDPAKESSVIAD